MNRVLWHERSTIVVADDDDESLFLLGTALALRDEIPNLLVDVSIRRGYAIGTILPKQQPKRGIALWVKDEKLWLSMDLMDTSYPLEDWVDHDEVVEEVRDRLGSPGQDPTIQDALGRGTLARASTFKLRDEAAFLATTSPSR